MPERSRPISVTRFERKLRSILGYSGSVILAGVEDHIAGLLLLEADRPEWALAGGENLAGGRQLVGAGVGLRSHVGLRNPAESGMVVVLEKMFIESGVLATFRLDQLLPAATLVSGVMRDTRAWRGGTPGSAATTARMVALQQAGVVAGTAFWSNDQVNHPIPVVVLGPGTEVLAEQGADNASIAAVMSWREIPLEGSLLG